MALDETSENGKQATGAGQETMTQNNSESIRDVKSGANLDSLLEKMSSLESKTAQLLNKSSNEKDLQSESLLDLDDDLDSKIEKKAAIIAAAKAEEIISRRESKKEEEQKVIRNKELAAQWDMRAEQEFPELKDKTSQFYKLVADEYNSSLSKDTPDAIYNAASRVFTKMAKEGRDDGSAAIRDFRISNGRSDFGAPSFSKPEKTDIKLKPHEIYFAQRLGMTEEAAKRSLARRAR